MGDFKEGMVLGDVCSEVVRKTQYPETHPTVGCGMETASLKKEKWLFQIEHTGWEEASRSASRAK